MSRSILVSLFLLAATALGGCSMIDSAANTISTTATTGDLAYGGFGGLALGAGVGALVGSLIENGDVMASSTLGAGIGLIAGLGVGSYYREVKQEKLEKENLAQIDANNRAILENETDIQELRLNVQQETVNLEPDPELREYQYTSPTLGVAY